AGTASERRIPISRDNYIVDGHHQWAATIGEDYKTGTDAGLTIPVDRIDEPITQILAQANAFAKHYGIPQESAFVPAATDKALAHPPAANKPTDVIVPDVTPRAHPALPQKQIGVVPLVPKGAQPFPSIPGVVSQDAQLARIQQELRLARAEPGITD